MVVCRCVIPNKYTKKPTFLYTYELHWYIMSRHITRGISIV